MFIYIYIYIYNLLIKKKIANVISSLNFDKTSDANSINYRILFPLKKMKFCFIKFVTFFTFTSKNPKYHGFN